MKKLKLTMNDYGALELRNLVRNKDSKLLMRAMDRRVDPGSIKTNNMLDMTFRSSGGSKSWDQIVRFFPIFNGELVGEISREDFKDTLEHSDVGVYCNCPHFEYSGAAYFAARENYGVVNESRQPQSGKDTVMCKHVYNAITVVSRNMDKISDKYYEILLKQNRIVEPEEIEEVLEEEEIFEEIVIPEDLTATPSDIVEEEVEEVEEQVDVQ